MGAGEGDKGLSFVNWGYDWVRGRQLAGEMRVGMSRGGRRGQQLWKKGMIG